MQTNADLHSRYLFKVAGVSLVHTLHIIGNVQKAFFAVMADSLWNVAATREDTVATGYLPTLAGRYVGPCCTCLTGKI